jgi:hypothetical protein
LILIIESDLGKYLHKRNVERLGLFSAEQKVSSVDRERRKIGKLDRMND